VTRGPAESSERALILAPHGRDAGLAAQILGEAGIAATSCGDLAGLISELQEGAGLALLVEEVLQEHGYAALVRWIDTQPSWSDFPIILLAHRGGGIERNPAAARLSETLGNITFLERPFHPTTLVSVVQTALRGRRRQYEARERLDTLRAAVLRQERDRKHLRLMVNELNHRVKNTLATVQSIVAQTLRSAEVPVRIRDTLTLRVLALSKAHDVLTDEQWSGADLRQIAAQAALPFRSGLGEDRVTLNGPDVRLPPKTAIAVALAVHELATNAVKYGALSGHDGAVSLDWTLSLEAGRRRLDMVWREHGGPVVKLPSRAGFGTRLIERGLAADLHGEVRIDYPPQGVICTISADLDAEESAPLATPDPAPETQAGIR
jgi:two-component sensor histidine kinase